MKKTGKLATLFIALALSLSLTACSDDSSEESSPVNKVSFPSYSTGKIIRNTVVSINSDVVYYEYLSFTSKTEGNYSLYKKSGSENQKVSSYIDRNGEAQEVPTKFTYEPSTGKFTANGKSSYLFNVETKSVIASEILTGEGKNIFSEWVSTSGIKILLKDDYTSSISKGDIQVDGTFDEADGWITINCGDSIPLFWSSDNKMYYLAYEIESTKVEAEGRSVNTNFGEYLINSPKLLLVDLSF